MKEKYDYEKEIRMARERADALEKQTPEGELEESGKTLDRMAAELEQRCLEQRKPAIRVKNEKRYRKFFRDVEQLKKLAQRACGILEVEVDEEALTGRAVLRSEGLMHTEDEYGDTTRFELAYFMMNYEGVGFYAQDGYVVFTITQCLYDEIAIEEARGKLASQPV